VRFQSELNVIRTFPNSIIIKIVRHDAYLTRYDQHESEKVLDDSLVDHVVYNDGTLDDLLDKIVQIIL